MSEFEAGYAWPEGPQDNVLYMTEWTKEHLITSLGITNALYGIPIVVIDEMSVITPPLCGDDE